MATPAIILVGTQLGENVGMAARAMLNCGLTDLRLVKPSCDPFNDYAVKAAAGAAKVVKNAKIYESLQAASEDLSVLYATSARVREEEKPLISPREAAADMAHHLLKNKIGIVFGREKSGLTNTHLSYCDMQISVPLNPAYTSLNLAQSVLVVAYEWYQIGQSMPAINKKTSSIAPKKELNLLFEQLETSLAAARFFASTPDKRPAMMRKVRHMFQRAQLTHSEVLALHGIFKALRGAKKQQKPVDK